ncbi:MAG: indole-3-glycerol phosphate synthase TrpC [Candidatus Goldiibacteriota bacterium]
MAAGILSKILKNKKKEVEAAKGKMPVEALLKEIMKAPANRNFRDLLEYSGFTIIGEIKKKTPSKGVLKKTVDVKKTAKIYAKAGIGAVSVVTDKKFFDGDLEYIKEVKRSASMPVLRKDFIIDEYQILESRYARADAVLLIASAIEKRQLNSFVKKIRSLNMTPVVECATKEEIKKACSIGVDIIGINTRDLKTFKINNNRLKNLIKYVPKDKMVIVESGIMKPEDVDNVMISPLIKGVLIGTMFMKAKGEKQIKDMAEDILYKHGRK